ncbi:MAG: hypothetical protein JO083_10110 [Candidatus Eremiobacteraeota bacterium]|nr:hypothetical protein [Candidatus Eremiobacteraeota bacterium]
MVRWVVFVALVVSSLACAGCGINWGDPSACYGDPSDPTSCPATPAPTDEPPQPPPQPDLTGCVPALLLFPPSGGTAPSTYAGTMYVTVPAGESPGSFLALVVRQTNPANQLTQGEIGTRLTDVSGAAPSYVPTPPPGYSGIYSSSNLPLVATWPTTILLADTRPNGVCPTLAVATLNPQSVLRAPRRLPF